MQIPLDAYQASSIPAVVEISGGGLLSAVRCPTCILTREYIYTVGGLVARNDEFAVLTTAVPSADPTGEDRG